MNELDLIKLNIYEAYDNGEITYGEKEYLLEYSLLELIATVNTATSAGIGALIGAGVSKSKIRKIYDEQHADEMAAAEEAGNMSEYIAKREAAIKEAGKKGAKKGALIGAGVGLAGNAATYVGVNKALGNTVSESTFDLLLESINDLYYDE